MSDLSRNAGLVACLVLLATSAGAAPEPRGRALIADSDRRLQSDTEYVRYRMELLDKAGKVQQTRILEIHEKHYPDRDVSLQKFLEPPVVEGTGMMIVDRNEASNDIWMYSPATRRLRRIAGAEKSNWYMGTEFTYEDFEDYQIGFYAFELLREAPCADGDRCHVIEAVPTSETERRASGYSKKVYWLERNSLYPVRVEYYSHAGEHVKTLEASGLGRIKDYWRPRVLHMRNLANGRGTRVTALERRLDEPLDEYYVSRRYLRTD